MGSLIGLLILGAIFGALARLFMRGKQNIGIIWTIILGALGALGGGWLADTLFGGSTIVTWIVGIVLSILLISLYLGFAGRRSTTT
ncbi:GlsB/YeaQ/YmgE family stress response membrane protein [Georgenia deserti]|uniref:GlsB/YeaQ/YmgE family stress response membrane protein n=1 Tax=Georgenia deserti TaxID=2093781 RepID=A0ABW4L0M8_9MICO